MKQAALIEGLHADQPPLVEGVGRGALEALISSARQSIVAGLPEQIESGPLRRIRPFDVMLLALAAEGLNDKAIARKVGATSCSVHQRWRMIREALEAKDRAHAVAIALTLKLIPPPQRALQILKEGWAGET
jgi:DNA-binding NarL/FixJ family response regulator